MTIEGPAVSTQMTCAKCGQSSAIGNLCQDCYWDYGDPREAGKPWIMPPWMEGYRSVIATDVHCVEELMDDRDPRCEAQIDLLIRLSREGLLYDE